MSVAYEQSPQISPNVYGIETEYSCMVTLPGSVIHEIVGSCHSVDAQLGLYQEPKEKGTASLSQRFMNVGLRNMGIYRNIGSGMMSNGARFYIDPSGPEYATPETSTAEEATHRMFDGDSVVLGIFEHLRKTDRIEGYQINRRIVDHNRTSRGIHLNTMTSLDEEPGHTTITNLATLNVVKGAIFGSGGLLIDEKVDQHFIILQDFLSLV